MLFRRILTPKPIYSTRLQNIEETEKAKRKLFDETQKQEQETKDEERKYNLDVTRKKTFCSFIDYFSFCTSQL